MGNRNMDPYKYEKSQGNKHGKYVMKLFFSLWFSLIPCTLSSSFSFYCYFTCKLVVIPP